MDKRLMHYQFPRDQIQIDGTTATLHTKVAAIVEDATDAAIVGAILEAARAEEVTDLYLLDKTFILDAIREKLERENPKPLTIEELRQMDGLPVYVSDLRIHDNSEYCIILANDKYGHGDQNRCAQIAGCECDWYRFDEYGERWIAYRHKPKEVVE